MKKIIKAFMVTACLFSTPAFAVDANNIAINDGDFSDVQELLNKMTPQQRAEVLKQAKEKEQSLQKLSPAQQDNLHKQLKDVSSTIKIDEIDPEKLNPSKSKSADQIRTDLNTYQKKYDAGTIKNQAVK